jgi:hypothetical protein
MMRASRRGYFGAILAAAIALALGARDAGAFQNYSESPGSGNCLTCHGNFRASSYQPPGGGPFWGTDLMSGHLNEITDCVVCHTGPGQFYPVSTFSSGSAIFDMSCLGCHGRFEDALGTFEASGLRQHHWRAGITLCGGCHPLDSDPALFVPVGEDTPAIPAARAKTLQAILKVSTTMETFCTTGLIPTARRPGAQLMRIAIMECSATVRRPVTPLPGPARRGRLSTVLTASTVPWIPATRSTMHV